jgi:hypothetical protein
MAVVLVFACIGYTADKEQFPDRPHPLFCTVARVSDTTVFVYHRRPTTGEEKKLHKTDLISALLGLEWDKLEVSNAEGKKLSKDEAKKVLTPGVIVLVSQDGKPVDANYLQAVKANTPVLVSKEKLTFVYPSP